MKSTEEEVYIITSTYLSAGAPELGEAKGLMKNDDNNYDEDFMKNIQNLEVDGFD